MDNIEENSTVESRIKTFAEFINRCYEETEYSRRYKRFGQKAITMDKIADPKVKRGWIPSDEARRFELERLNKLLTALNIDTAIFKDAHTRQYALTEPACNFFHYLLFLISEDEASLIRRSKFDQLPPSALIGIRAQLITAIDSTDLPLETCSKIVGAFEQRTGCLSLLGTYEICTLTNKTKAEMIRAIASIRDKKEYLELFFMDDSALPIPQDAPWWEAMYNDMIVDYTDVVAPAFIRKWKHIAEKYCAEQGLE